MRLSDYCRHYEEAKGTLLERTARGRHKQPTDVADLKALANELGGLALALEQAGAYIVQQRESFRKYLELWRLHADSVQDWHDQRTTKYPRSLAITWQTTIDKLGAPERVLLDILAWFSPDPIPLTVLSNLGSVATEHDWTDCFRRSLARLADYSMVTWNVESEAVYVHRVVQEILRSRQTEPKKWLTAVLQLLKGASPHAPSDVRSWPIWERLRAHVSNAVEEADRLEIAEPTTFLMGHLAGLLSAKALHKEAEQLERRALEVDTAVDGSESTTVATRLNNLAQTLFATNRLVEAEPLMRRSLAIDERSHGPEHPDVATDLNNLALLLQATNRLSEAEPLMRRALAIAVGFERRTGREHSSYRSAATTAQHHLAAAPTRSSLSSATRLSLPR